MQQVTQVVSYTQDRQQSDNFEAYTCCVKIACCVCVLRLTIQHAYCSRHAAHPAMSAQHTEDVALLQHNTTLA